MGGLEFFPANKQTLQLHSKTLPKPGKNNKKKLANRKGEGPKSNIFFRFCLRAPLMVAKKQISQTNKPYCYTARVALQGGLASAQFVNAGHNDAILQIQVLILLIYCHIC